MAAAPLRIALPIALALANAGCGAGDAGTARRPEPPCPQVTAPAPRAGGELRAPRRPLAGTDRPRLRFVTSCGTFAVEVHPRRAPRAAASVVALARRGFYDGTVLHRLVPGYVVQGGDPTGSGTGGPGYRTRDRVATRTSYPRGTVAMARAETEPPGAAGSQFFIVAAKRARLPPEYAIVGRVVAGLAVVDRIASTGDAATERPRRPVVLRAVRISSRE